mmetsp:Transcript_3211/g.3134  ORF Transcript_3211/g.3134 Transcript_3211/m.3134 type:complete len:92 (-) Transcript_3211:702-977(-)
MKVLVDKFLSLKPAKDKFFEGVSTLSTKFLIKLMNSYLIERMCLANESKQHFSEFIYDVTIKLFGVGKLAEKRIKEVLLTIDSSQIKIPRC